MKQLPFFLGRVPPKGRLFVPSGATYYVSDSEGSAVQRLTFLASRRQIFSRLHPCLPPTDSRREQFRLADFLSGLFLPMHELETED